MTLLRLAVLFLTPDQMAAIPVRLAMGVLVLDRPTNSPPSHHRLIMMALFLLLLIGWYLRCPIHKVEKKARQKSTLLAIKRALDNAAERDFLPAMVNGDTWIVPKERPVLNQKTCCTVTTHNVAVVVVVEVTVAVVTTMEETVKVAVVATMEMDQPITVVLRHRRQGAWNVSQTPCPVMEKATIHAKMVNGNAMTVQQEQSAKSWIRNYTVLLLLLVVFLKVVAQVVSPKAGVVVVVLPMELVLLVWAQVELALLMSAQVEMVEC